jgi:cytochrome c5
LGDKEAWAPRIATGVDAMLAVAIQGKNAMPPKGACMSCSDAELKAAIEYMVSQSQ